MQAGCSKVTVLVETFLMEWEMVWVETLQGRWGWKWFHWVGNDDASGNEDDAGGNEDDAGGNEDDACGNEDDARGNEDDKEDVQCDVTCLPFP